MYLTGGDDRVHRGGCGRVISNLRWLRLGAHSNATGTSGERNFGPSWASFLGAEDGGRPRGRPRYEPISGTCWPLIISSDTVAADSALQNNRASRAASTFPTHTEPSESEIFLGLQAPSCASGTKIAKRPSFATYKRSSPRISQALCPVSCTGIRASYSLIQMLRSADFVQRGGSAASSRHFGGNDSTPCPHPLHASTSMAILPPAAPVTFLTSFPHLETADCATRGCNHFVFSQ